jgi:hypothetical protein
MKVEYLKDGSEDCPLIRLYAFTTSEAGTLHDAFCSLASGSMQSARLTDILPIEAVDGCNVSFIRGSRDRGVVPITERMFNVELSASGWDNTAGLTEPFRDGCLNGHQWLTCAGEIRLLLSTTGAW